MTPAVPNSSDTDRPSVGDRFRRLAAEWRARPRHTSRVEDMALHPAYQRIIGMGEPAVPLILAELQRETDHWFWALAAITEADPVPEAARGNLAPMAEAWTSWGRDHGYRW